MSTLQKILQLIPDHWENILVKAHQFEGYIYRAENFVNGNKTKLDDLIIKLFNKLDIDWPGLLASIEKRAVYKKFASINIDIPGFITIPADFDADDSTQLQALIHDKLDFIKQALSPVEFERLNLSDVFSQLEGIIQSLLELPSDIDFSDTAAVNEYKNTAIEAIKPQLMALISSVFNIDLGGSNTSSSDSSVSYGIGNGFDKIQVLSDELSAVYAENTSQDESNDQDAVEQNSDEQALEQQGTVADILGGIEKLRLALPVLKNQFSGKNIAGIDASELIDIADDLLVLISENLAEVIDMIMAVDWQALDMEGFISEAKAILGHVKAIITGSNLAELYEKINWPESSISPIKLVGISNDEAIAQLKAIIATPESINSWDDIDELSPIDLVKLLKTRLEKAFVLLGHIELFGITSETIKQFIDKITEPFELLFNIPEDHDFSDLKAYGRLLLDKLMQVATLFMPELAESEGNTTHNTDGTENTDGTQDTTQAENTSLSVISIIFVAIKKAQLIYDFIQANNIGFGLQDKQGSAASGQQPQHNTQATGTDAQAVSSTTDQTANTAPDQTQSTTQTTNETTIQAQQNTVADDDILQALLGNKETGLISKLENEADQDFILDLLAGTLLESTIDTVLAWPETQELKNTAEEKFDALLLMLNLNSDNDVEANQPVVVPLLSGIIAMLFSAMELAYKAFMLVLQKLIETAIEFIHRFVTLCFTLLKSATIPTDQLPEFIAERLCPIIEYEAESEDGTGQTIQSDDTPNILCLLIAMPVTTMKKFLDLPMKEIQGWIAGVV